MSSDHPTTLLAEITHRCPLHCPYCSNPLEMNRADQEMKTEDWKRVFTQARELGVLQLGLPYLLFSRAIKHARCATCLIGAPGARISAANRLASVRSKPRGTRSTSPSASRSTGKSILPSTRAICSMNARPFSCRPRVATSGRTRGACPSTSGFVAVTEPFHSRPPKPSPSLRCSISPC